MPVGLGDLAHFLPRVEPHACLGVVGPEVPAAAAQHGRAEHGVLPGDRGIAVDQLSVLVDCLDERHMLVNRPDVLNVAVGTVVDEDEATLGLVQTASCRPG